ncbi:MAG: L-ribulose-5-phosphate 4-epimerase AraD [Kiritimatiellaeota bacterium]|nr:L-ribulose-5-phosphate 4-epimerase AraD [Kiritimatiellota bacterium]
MPIKTKSIRRALADLIRRVWEENIRLKASGLVTMTWGNVSGIDRRRGIVVIKPSGMDYAALRPDDMVLTDLEGRRLEPASRLEPARLPSTDLPTHLVLYRAFAEIGGVVHTHSTYATAFAQACRSLPCLGTTHADYCYGAVPVTEVMRPPAIREQYEANTGRMIVRKTRQLRLQPMACPFILVANHGPFAWGATPAAAVENAIVLEAISKMALLTFLLDSPRRSLRRSLGGRRKGISQVLLDKHYLRKHGPSAYYGQAKHNPSK